MDSRSSTMTTDPHYSDSGELESDDISGGPASHTQPNLEAFDETARDTIIQLREDTSQSQFDKEDGEDSNDEAGEVQGGSSEEGELSEEEIEKDEPDPDLEEGEVGEKPKKPKIPITAPVSEPAEDLEEGEVEDEDDASRRKPTSICRFFGKGQCTWGSNCRFLHPGVIDKGLYNMFDPLRPPPPNATLKPGLLGHAPPNYPKPGEEGLLPHPLVPSVSETSWERAQRQAKELIKKSEQRKEADIDFEDKKMNLTLTQEEFDKENDYYTKKSPEKLPSPIPDDDEEDQHLLLATRERRRERNAPLMHSPPRNSANDKIDPDFVRERVHHIRVRQAPPRDSVREAPPRNSVERDREPRMVRESAIRRQPTRYHNVRPEDLSPVRRGNNYDSRKSEEWHDPWIRSRRPGRVADKRSSYSSSSRSSSSSSSSSSGSTRKKRVVEKVRKAPPRRDSPSPPPNPKMRIAPPIEKEEFNRGGGAYVPRVVPVEKGGKLIPRTRGGPVAATRIGARNNRTKSGDYSGSSSSRSPSRSRSRSGSFSGSRSRSRSKSKSVTVTRLKRRSKFSRDRSASSRSHSRSRSGSRVRRTNNKRYSYSRSDSSSEDEKDSFGRTRVKRKRNLSGSPTPEIPAKIIKPEPTEKLSVNSLTQKRVSPPTKTSSSKPQVKMTLKPSGGLKVNKSVLDRLADDVLDDDDDDDDDDDVGSLGSNPAHSGDNSGDANNGTGRSSQSSLRREELLRQLRKVEDAIAKKRSKIDVK